MEHLAVGQNSVSGDVFGLKLPHMGKQAENFSKEFCFALTLFYLGVNARVKASHRPQGGARGPRNEAILSRR